MMKITESAIQLFLEGKTTPEQTIDILASIASDPQLEEYVITSKRMKYTQEQMQDYGSFIPAAGMAADDGHNLCDFQCETYILRKEGIDISFDDLRIQSKSNYWLRDQGTPLFNIGKLLEVNGMLVNRLYDVTIDRLKDIIKDQYAIVVVNGEALEGLDADIYSQEFTFEESPNHAVIVLGINDTDVKIYNPAFVEESKWYPIDRFIEAWRQSRYYTVAVRRKLNPYEYNPQPIDVSSVSLNPELMELIELIAENAHDVWAVGKALQYPDKSDIYAPLDNNGQEQKGHNHYFLPYRMLSEQDKLPDREMAINTIKLVKRLGYRLVNINGLHRCPECGAAIEEDDNFCRICGRQLSWADFSIK